MLPILLNFKFIKVYTFGVFLLLGFLWGVFVLWRNIRLTSFKEDEVFDGLFIGLMGGLFFGRLVYVMLNFGDFGFNFLKFILINGYPGLSLFGVIFGISLTLWIFFKARKIKYSEIMDYFMTPFFIALIFGKLGGFFSGAEVGAKTNFILRIKYFGFDGLRHLTPFYEVLMFAIGAVFAQKILLSIRKEKYFPGFLFIISIWYFSAVYLLFDNIKVNRLYFLGHSFNKIVSGVLLLTIGFYLIYYFRNGILSFLGKYGQEISKKIRFRSKRETTEGKGKNSKTD